MSLINSLLNIFVGDKSKKDLKEVESIVNDILSYENELSTLNHNELRNKTLQFKNQINSVRVPFDNSIIKLKSRINLSNNIDEKENLFQEIDKLNESSDLKVEDKLNIILPEALCRSQRNCKKI